MSRRILVLAAFAALASAQTPGVIELARKAPPELFADAVIKLMERGGIPADRQRELLNDAFQAAKSAREPVRLRALPRVGSNTRAELRDFAGALGLDALSLQTRVIQSMAAADAAAGQDKARELFRNIEHPALEARPCEDPMIADASAYYEMASRVAPTDLMLALGPARSPGELASFATILAANVSLPPEDFTLLTGALALKMQTAAPDYRSFALTADELRAALERIAARARELGVSSPVGGAIPLAEAVRKLILVQMSSPRCHEEFGDAVQFVQWFNGRYRGALPVIEPEELEPLKTLGWFEAPSYFESEDSKKIAGDFAGLRMSLGKAGGKPAWRDMLAEFLKEFSAWKPSGANIDVFHQRITVLHGLYQLIPPGEDLDSLIARVVEALRSSGIEREYPAEWLFQVKSLAASPMGDRAKLLAAFRESEDPGLALFAALDAVPAAVLQR